MSHDWQDYDRQVARNATRAANTIEAHNGLYHSKSRDERGLEIIAAALASARTASGAEHIDRWADAAWQLALEMFGS